MNIVITTISEPTLGTRTIAQKLGRIGGCLWLIGDSKGPFHCDLPNTRLLTIERQRKLDFYLVKNLPENHYSRKNLGYLLAMESGAPFIVETDDDNIPEESFWQPRHRELTAECYRRNGWINVYTHFTEKRIWPRGLPLNCIQSYDRAALGAPTTFDAAIQQGLADANPDVDAIFRMVSDLPFHFDAKTPLALGRRVWCPFNSQNTTFFSESFPLLYLPSHCTFRMTDIWRSFIAQRCLWEMDFYLAFTSATVRQERNEHDLMRDFADEVPGYLNNAKICEILEALCLQSGRDPRIVTDNMMSCYEALVANGIFPKKEIGLVASWCKDVLALG